MALSREAARAGAMARVKPSLAASFKRTSGWLTGRTSPDRLISPKQAVPSGIGLSLIEDISAAATARSAAGSPMRRPPATLR